jgi:hypothetical protein
MIFRRPHARLALAFAIASATPALATAQTDPYAGYESLLRAVVRNDGVDYRALRQRIGELRAFSQWLAEHGPTATPAEFAGRDAQLAYWLNAYNATVLRAIAESPESMRNVLESQPNSGFFRARTHRVDRRSLTLDALENQEIRARFRDPRVHVALNCGARSCPPLSATAFRARTVSAQLDRLASAWVDRSAVTLDAGARVLRASMLFQWFSDDFAGNIPGRTVAGVSGPLRFVMAFASSAKRAALVSACGANLSGCRVEHVPYDWSLNAAQ